MTVFSGKGFGEKDYALLLSLIEGIFQCSPQVAVVMVLGVYMDFNLNWFDLNESQMEEVRRIMMVNDDGTVTLTKEDSEKLRTLIDFVKL